MSDEFPFDIEYKKVEIGEIYPIYGMVTQIFDEFVLEDDKKFKKIEINKHVTLLLPVDDSEHTQNILKTLEERLFDYGIFVTQISETTPNMSGICKTVIFGKKTEYTMN